MENKTTVTKKHDLIDVYSEILLIICAKILHISIAYFIADYRLSIHQCRLSLGQKVSSLLPTLQRVQGRAEEGDARSHSALPVAPPSGALRRKPRQIPIGQTLLADGTYPVAAF